MLAIRIKYQKGGKKNSGVGNINQSVHLVGNHMAHQHANCANLLIFSNRVQLIPLAAFISPSHTGAKMVCYDFLLIFLKSVLHSSSFFFKRLWSPTQVMNEVDMRASGSCCGSGRGVTEGKPGKKWRN